MTRQLNIEPLGEAVEVAEGQTIPDACLWAGVYFSQACGHGLCSACKTLPGLEGSRAFSIANPPSDGGHVEWRISRAPGGAGYAHERLKRGDRLTLSGPYVGFLVRMARGGPLLFLVGAGVSSPRAMILEPLEEGYAEPIALIHGGRAEADLYGREEFAARAQTHENFRYIPALSPEPEGGAWQGERGFVHDVAKRAPKSPGFKRL